MRCKSIVYVIIMTGCVVGSIWLGVQKYICNIYICKGVCVCNLETIYINWRLFAHAFLYMAMGRKFRACRFKAGVSSFDSMAHGSGSGALKRVAASAAATQLRGQEATATAAAAAAAVAPTACSLTLSVCLCVSVCLSVCLRVCSLLAVCKFVCACLSACLFAWFDCLLCARLTNESCKARTSNKH